jgi:alpha-glucosidase
VFARTDGADLGRDGCRVPMPWGGQAPPFEFSPAGAHTAPWLPLPSGWQGLTVAAQDSDLASMLNLYRQALRLRRAEPSLGAGELRWLDSAEGVLAFVREPGLICVANLSGEPVPLPANDGVLLTSGPLSDGLLPTDTAAWLRHS